MEYQSTLSFTSENHPGVTVTLHKPSYGRRLNLDRMTGEFRSKVRNIQKKHAKLQAEIEAAGDNVSDDQVDQLRELNAEALRATAESYNPQLLRWGVAHIDGLEIDGQPAQVEQLIADGPPDLVHEIIARIEQVRGLTSGQLKNSSLPSISSGREDGSENTTTATSASPAESIGSETAGESTATMD